MVGQIVTKIGLTAVLIFLIYFVWTNEIDIRKTIVDPLTSFVKVKKQSKFDVNYKQIAAARWINPGNTKSGNLCLVFYDLKFINRLAENVTIKKVVLRYKLPMVRPTEVEAETVLTGKVDTPDGPSQSLLLRTRGNNIILMDWSNIRTVIGTNKLLPAAGVLSASAVFVLDIKNSSDLVGIEYMELIAIDYSDNETAEPITVVRDWVQGAENSLLESRRWQSDGKQGLEYLN